jgi:hypothetical protein
MFNGIPRVVTACLYQEQWAAKLDPQAPALRTWRA